MKTSDSCSGAWYSGGGLRNTVSRIASVAVVLPIPAASERIATALAIGYLARLRTAHRASWFNRSSQSRRFELVVPFAGGGDAAEAPASAGLGLLRRHAVANQIVGVQFQMGADLLREIGARAAASPEHPASS